MRFLRICRPRQTPGPGTTSVSKRILTAAGRDGRVYHQAEVIRSDRRTISLQIKPDGRIVIRAPHRVPERELQAFFESRIDWVEKHLAEIARRQAQKALEPVPNEMELRKKRRAFAPLLEERVAYFAERMDVTYGRIAIRNQKTRWGSCSSKGNLNFNALLMLAPPEVLDSVVVHELCHRKEMNHSERFYREVLRVFPEYHRWHGWLKENGSSLLARIPRS